MMSRYTEEYPPLREIRRQRAQAEKLITDLPASQFTKSAAVAANQTGSESDRTHGKVNTVAFESAPHGSNEHRSKLSTELQTLNDQEFELSQLEREVRLLETICAAR